MHPERDLAIVLRSIRYEERHRIVTALTEHHGKVTAIAKNSVQSRRFGGTLELFAASEWQFQIKSGAELYHLNEASIRQPFEGLRSDLEKLSLASTLTEFILKISPQNEPCPDLFKLHSNALFTLDQLTDPSVQLAILNAYLAKLLQWSGNQPLLQNCLQCSVSLHDLETTTQLSCMIADAGWICQNCRNKSTRHVQNRDGQLFQHSMLRLSVSAARDFQQYLNISIRKVPLYTQDTQATDPAHLELFRFLEALYVYHIPGFDRKSIKSLRFLGLESSVQHPAMNPQ